MGAIFAGYGAQAVFSALLVTGATYALNEATATSSYTAPTQTLFPVDKTSGQEEETLKAPELGNETARKKKTSKASFSVDLTEPAETTGINVTGTSTPNTDATKKSVTGVQI